MLEYQNYVLQYPIIPTVSSRNVRHGVLMLSRRLINLLYKLLYIPLPQ